MTKANTAVVRVFDSQIGAADDQPATAFAGRLASQFLLRSASELTRRNYLANLQQFVLFSGCRDAAAVRPDDVLAWRDHLINRGLAPHTIDTKLATLSAFFEFLRDAGAVERNPATARLVPRPAKPLQSPKGRALSVKEVRYLLYTIGGDDPTDRRDLAIIYAMLRLSLRVSEIAGIKVSDIKRDGRHRIVEYRSKGGRRERQPLPADVGQMFDDYLAADRSGRAETKTGGAEAFLFQAEASRRNYGASEPLSTRHIWHIVKTRGRLAGLGKLAPHDLRRTAITRAFEQGVPVTAILNMSKHRSVETLMIYNKGLDNLANNAVHQINYDRD